MTAPNPNKPMSVESCLDRLTLGLQQAKAGVDLRPLQDWDADIAVLLSAFQSRNEESAPQVDSLVRKMLNAKERKSTKTLTLVEEELNFLLKWVDYMLVCDNNQHNFENLDHLTNWLLSKDALLTHRTEETDGRLAASLNIIDSIEAMVRKAEEAAKAPTSFPLAGASEDVPMQNALHSVISGILASAAFEAHQVYRAVKDHPGMEDAFEAISAMDPDAYSMALTYKLEMLEDGLLDALVRDKPEVKFIFKEYRFLERQLVNMFEKYEGFACSVDKARTVVGEVLWHFATGRTIALDYKQKYTYHLPKKVLASPEDMLAFFQAVRNLFYGRNDQYLEFCHALENRMKQAEAAS